MKSVIFLIFILFSPIIISLHHFINIIIFSGVLYILLCLLNFVDNQIKFDNKFCFIIATISIISFFLSSQIFLASISVVVFYKINKKIEKRITAKYHKIKDWVMDPKGYFLIKIDRFFFPT